MTPLMMPWSYQANVHELFGICNHVVDLSKSPGTSEAQEKIVLSPEHDDFFQKNMFFSWDVVVESVKQFLEKSKDKRATSQSQTSTEDLKKVLEEFSEDKKQQTNMKKHVSLLNEITLRMKKESLDLVSLVEQHLAALSENHSDNIEVRLKYVT